MDDLDQRAAMSLGPLAKGETARFFAASRLEGIDCLSATFRTHVYPPHMHETYVVGTIESGWEKVSALGMKGRAGPGDLVFVMPQDVHDGAPAEGGYSYRMTYPAEEFLRDLAEAVSRRPAPAAPFFRSPVVHDPEGARLFSAAHEALESGVDGLAGEELMLRAYARAFVLHAGVPPAPAGEEAGPVHRVRDLIEARYAEDLSLAELAAVAGFSRDHLIRVFRRSVGITPHAYVVDVRVRRAQDRLRAGRAPAEVAAEVGFADQAHLTRAFKARIGVAPAAYRRAVAA
ncbi:AraC family transcriptional regulator [Phreatobacter cathodiphilus]|uniref:AraC family transcriptional regulator n=1 Tax=Phreatobacter cathodiphilus TaxID=1868589 RepID=A0A2S0NDC8_9HYPH|nr:AraC family transcriptional regulator [Phreatobacter cathodiphilus]AVO46046.1 AraC family transcriptional regulator [Phreatobacter cathodiphilus]